MGDVDSASSTARLDRLERLLEGVFSTMYQGQDAKNLAEIGTV